MSTNESGIKWFYFLTFLILCLLVLALIFIIIKIVNPGPQTVLVMVSKTAQYVVLATTSIAIISYLLGFIIAGKSNKKHLEINYFNHQTILWYRPKYFRFRFKENLSLSILMGVFVTTIVYFVMMASLLIFISLKNYNDIKKYHNNTVKIIVTDTTRHNITKLNSDTSEVAEKELYVEKTSENFIFNVGLPFTLLISLLTVITYLNTEIIKKRGETELYSLSEIYEILIDKLNELTPIIERCLEGKHSDKKNRFYYVIDQSLSLGHVSAKDSVREEFNNFNDIFRRFYLGDHTTIKAIILDDDALRKNYKAIFRSQGQELENQINDSKATYNNLLNGKYNDGNIGEQSYKKSITIGKRDIPIEVDPNYQFSDMSDQDIINYSNMNPENFENDTFSRILRVTEIGMTRMIVTNSFVLTFISYEIPSTNGNDGKVNKPIAYFTEELLAIEKSKVAFMQNYLRFCKLKADEFPPVSAPATPNPQT